MTVDSDQCSFTCIRHKTMYRYRPGSIKKKTPYWVFTVKKKTFRTYSSITIIMFSICYIRIAVTTLDHYFTLQSELTWHMNIHACSRNVSTTGTCSVLRTYNQCDDDVLRCFPACSHMHRLNRIKKHWLVWGGEDYAFRRMRDGSEQLKEWWRPFANPCYLKWGRSQVLLARKFEMMDRKTDMMNMEKEGPSFMKWGSLYGAPPISSSAKPTGNTNVPKHRNITVVERKKEEEVQCTVSAATT